MIIFNYAVRAAIILVGVGILGGVLRSPAFTDAIHVAFGWVVIAFGCYRMVAFAMGQRKGHLNDENNDQ
jgi:hypothetical protein